MKLNMKYKGELDEIKNKIWKNSERLSLYIQELVLKNNTLKTLEIKLRENMNRGYFLNEWRGWNKI